jgi:hypothetical protein
MLSFLNKAANVVLCALLSSMAAAQIRVASPQVGGPAATKPSPASPADSAHRAPAAARAVRFTGAQPSSASMPVRAAAPVQGLLPIQPSTTPPAAPSRPPTLVREPELPIPAITSAPLPAAAQEASFAVDYRDGLLSVVAEKAELGKVMNLVGSKTGATIEVAPEVTGEPVVAHLGPGSPRQILSQLLDSPHLAYIVMGSDEDGALQRIVIRKRNSFGRQPAVAMRAPVSSPEPLAETQLVQEQEQTGSPAAAAEQAQQAPVAEQQANPPQQ